MESFNIIEKLKKDILSLFDKFTEIQHIDIYKDNNTKDLCFKIVIKGGFDKISIEGPIRNNTIDILKEKINEMKRN